MEEAPRPLLDFIAQSRISLSLASASDPDLPLIAVNDGFSKLTGFAGDEVLGRNCRFLQREHRDERPLGELRHFLADDRRNHLRVTLINFRKEGIPFVNLLALSRLRDLSGRTRFFFASQFDVSRARTDQLRAYDKGLHALMPLPSQLSRDTGLILSGSIAAIADAASAIAQAKLTLEHVEVVAPLY